jgi:hypothetical protein
MPTTNPEKNREYVRTSNMKKKEQIGEEEYNKYFANNQQKYRDNKKSTDEKAELYKKQQAEYMKQYRAKKKASKTITITDEKTNAINTLTNAIKARKARNELLNKAIVKANETADKLSKIYKEVMPKVNGNKHKRRKLAVKYDLM